MPPTCATKVFKAKLPKNAPLGQGTSISLCWSLKCCWTRHSWRVKSRTRTLGSEGYLYPPALCARGRRAQSPSTGGARTPWTDRYRGGMSRCGQEALKAQLICMGLSTLHQEGSPAGSMPRPVRECHQWEPSGVGLGIKGKAVEMPLCKWAFPALPGSSPEALEHQAGNRKLIRSVFERLLGWWVLLGLFIPLNCSNLPCWGAAQMTHISHCQNKWPLCTLQ